MITTEIAGDAKSVIELISLLDPTFQISCKRTCRDNTHILTCAWFGQYVAFKIYFDHDMKIVSVDELRHKGCRGLNHEMMQAVQFNWSVTEEIGIGLVNSKALRQL